MQRDALYRPHGIREVVLDGDIDRRIIHVVFDTFAINHFEPSCVPLSKLDVGTKVESPAEGATTEVDLVGVVSITPRHASKDACQLDISPLSAEACLPGKVGQIKLWPDVVQLNPIRVDALIGARARPFEGNGNPA